MFMCMDSGDPHLLCYLCIAVGTALQSWAAVSAMKHLTVTHTLEKDAQVCNCSVTANSPEVSTSTTSFGTNQLVMMEHMQSCAGSTVQRGPVAQEFVIPCLWF